MTRILPLLGTLALGCGLAIPVQAAPAPGDEVRSQVVELSDLDLSSTPGATAAVQRINLAARGVCDEYADSTRDMGARARARNCRHHAMDTAVASLAAPLVTAAYYGETSRTIQTAAATPTPLPGK